MSLPKIYKYNQLKLKKFQKSILSLNNSDPFLLEIQSNDGQILFLSSPLDLSWNNFGLKGLLIPLIHRALILSANIALQEGEYEDAKKRFESYLSEYETDGNWLTEAKIGQAICKEAEGDVKSAINVYQSLTNSISSSIQQRTIALLESAKVDLDPLPSRPEPVKEPEKPNTSKGIELEKNTPTPLDPEAIDNK